MKKRSSLVVNVVVFCVALVAMVGAGGMVYYFLKNSAPSSSGSGTFSLGLCDASSPEDVLIGTYLDTNAALLEQPAGTDDTPVSFVIDPGENATVIAERLADQNLIVDAELFRRYVQYYGLDAEIEAGTFTLQQTMTIPEIAEALQQGFAAEQFVTIQEGLRLEQVAAVVAAQTTISEQEFLSLATSGWRTAGLDYAFLSRIPDDATLEGFLFPNTYRLPEEATAMDMLVRMLQTFDEQVSTDIQAAAANRGMDIYELVTLASIVEREAVLDEERALIAGVYHNRLDSGWFLNADPTIQYGLGLAVPTDDWWPVLTLDDLAFDTPYNSYLYLGLPPTPIFSPGLASIQATANPTETDYFYFLADCNRNDGSHLFSVTEEEHTANYVMCGGEVSE